MRFNLGLVRYHVGAESASHDYYMSEIGVRERCHYPSFSGDPKEAFLGLAHDLTFADDFLTGTGALLRQAAKRESSDNAERNADLKAGYVSDKQKFTFRSYFAAIHHHQYYVFMTARTVTDSRRSVVRKMK